MVNVLAFTTLIAATYAVLEQCDNYGSGENKYWEDTIEYDGTTTSTYCRLVYCVKQTDPDNGNVYGTVQNYWRLDAEASEYKIQQQCDITCKFAEFIASNTCGCPSCPTTTCTDDVFTCPDSTTISRNDNCEFAKDTCCIEVCGDADGTVLQGALKEDADNGNRCEYVDENGIALSCPTVGCTDDTYTCIDKTVLPARDDTDCKFPCPDTGCDTKVCCDGVLYEKECAAQRECDGTMNAYPVACTDDVHQCPDGVTSISRNECCQFEMDDCCIKDCADGTKLYGTYYLNEDGTEGCKYENECGTSGNCPTDTHECLDKTVLSTRDDTTCKFICPDNGCNTKVCCDGTLYSSECVALRYQCYGSYQLEAGPVAACTDDVMICPTDGTTDVTDISRNDCCAFEEDTCCIKTCDGVTYSGYYYANDNADGSATCKYKDENWNYIDTPCQTVGCTDDTYTCIDTTVLPARDDTDCKFPCPDTGCDSKVCCDGVLYEKECAAQRECDGTMDAYPMACTDDVHQCPDDATSISRNECCQFEMDECCIKDCADGTKLYGTYYLNDDDTEGCKYENECAGTTCTDDVFICPDSTTISRNDNCEFEKDTCCVKTCEDADGTVLQGALKEDAYNGNHCEYVDENGIALSCPTVGCTDDTYTCIDKTVLAARDDTDCKFPCPDSGCDSNVCCDGELYEKECEAQRECDGTISAVPTECNDDAAVCPDGVTSIGRNRCCQFEMDDCCIIECDDGTKIYGEYYLNDDNTEECKYENECGVCTEDLFSCPDGTTISRDDNCEFDEDSCCRKSCDSDATEPIQGEYYENDDGSDGCKYDPDCTTTTTTTGACSDGTVTCSDGTVLQQSATDGSCECPADVCVNIVCCGTTEMSECQAINGCPDYSDPLNSDATEKCVPTPAGAANKYGVMMGIGFVIIISWWM